MSLSLFESGGMLFVLRWIHFLAGITWIGMLYYFNFVQGAFFNETDAPTKSNAIQKLVPRALWWFRWGAMVTFLSGWAYIGMSGNHYFANSYGIFILTGATLASLMWFNVWFVIWPCQKVVIASATQVAKGGQAIPEAAARGARAMVASRTNVLFSIPMLFFMGAASHLGMQVNEGANLGALVAVLAVIFLALEANALKGKLGPLTKVSGVIHCGLALTLVLYFIIEFMTK